MFCFFCCVCLFCFFCICVFRFSHSFCNAALWVTFHLQQHHTDSVCTHAQLQGPLQPASFKRRGSMIAIPPARAFIPVAVCCPAQTLPSKQTTFPWWTEAGLFTPCVKVLSGWLCQLGEGSLTMICGSQVSDVNRRTLWFCKLSSQIVTASQVPVKRWRVEGGWQKVIKNSLFFCL